MPDKSVLISLSQLVDLALNSPEVGAVNFNILHSVLHVLIQQVDLSETKVEFKGSNGDRIESLLHCNKLEKLIFNQTEYVVVSEKDPKKDRYKKFSFERGSVDEVLVVDKGKNAIMIPGESPVTQTVVVVETADACLQVSPVLSQTKLLNLEAEVNNLKEEIKQLKELPSNTDILKAARSSHSTPVVDIIQILTLTKRIEAAEEGVEKLASLIEDLAKEQIDDSNRKSIISIDKKRSSSTYSFAAILNERVTKLEQRVDELEVIPVAPPVDENANRQLQMRLAEIEDKLREYASCVGTSNGAFEEEFQLLQNQILGLEKEIGEVIEKINLGFPGGDIESTDKYNRKLYEKVINLETEFEKFAKMVSTQFFDHEDRQATLDVLVEQIELLKTVKADREYINDALADKADKCTVNRKVSHAQFEASYDNLTHTLAETIQKLQVQEAMWQQALFDIQQEIGSKLDKMELTPLRDFVHNKLKMLQEKLKSLGSLRHDPEAAGAKSKILRNLKCISCDAEVVMRKEVDSSLYQPSVPLPSSKNLSPYLAYELDQLRKQKNCLPHGRNLIHFENAVTRDETGKREHVCNRYCGGSHTTTTPQQRIAKGGNFLQQWGVNEKEMYEGNIKGVDGQLYKSREHGEFIQLQCKPENTYMKTMVITGGILSECASTKSSAATIDNKTVLPAIPNKTR